VRVSREVDAPAEAAWRVLTDTREWPAWGPSVVEVIVSPGPVLTAASRGRVKTALGVWLPFRVTRFEEGARWDWVVAGVPATGHLVEPLGPGRCLVSFEVPTWAAPYALVCRAALGRIAERVAR
jgi:hypothetical protein